MQNALRVVGTTATFGKAAPASGPPSAACGAPPSTGGTDALPRPGDPDTKLIRAAATGDTAAFGELYARNAERAMRVSLFLLGSRPEAEDAVHDAFLRAWRGLRSFRPGAPFYPWFHRILRHEVGNRLERRARRRVLSTSAAGPPAELARDAELRLALDGLDLPKREAVLLHYVLGYSVTEVARMCGVPPGTVKSRLRLARGALARALGDGGQGRERE